MTTPVFRKWKSIDKFSDAYKLSQRYGVTKLTYNAKIKLHGTNAGIRIMPDGSLQAQKRSSDISVGNDNAGFAAFVDKLVHDEEYCKTWPQMNGVIFYGEWAGKGVQAGDAVSQTDKAFYIFSIYAPALNKVITDPVEIYIIAMAVFENLSDQKILILPWHYEEDLEVNMLDQAEAQKFVDKITADVDAIGEEDPYIRTLYGVSGPGEGLVFYCESITTGLDGLLDGDQLNEMLMGYMFKHKTEAHSVNKSKKRNHVAPEKPEGVEDFIDMFVTEARMNQMIADHNIEVDRKNTGVFLKAVMSDIHKESQNEIEAADFEWKVVPKYASPRIRAWWFAMCDKL